MHSSTHNWMRAETLEVTLKRIKRLGFESIEISGEPDAVQSRASRPAAAQGVRDPLLHRGSHPHAW